MTALFLKLKAHVSQKEFWILGAILFLAALLRFWALDFGLPNTSRPDEEYISYTALYRILNNVITGQGDLNPHFFEYPTFFIHLVAGAYGLFFGFGTWLGVFPDFSAFLRLYADNISMFHFISRWLSALMGTATVWVVYGIAKRLVPESKSFPPIAALLMAVAYLHVRDSHFGVTDVPMTLWLSLSLLFTLKLYQEPFSGKNLFLASGFAGWAAATKYPGILVALPLFLALAIKPQQTPKAYLQQASLAVLGGLGAFFVVAPYVFLEFPAVYKALTPLATHLAQGHGGIGQAFGWQHHLIFTLFYGLGALYEGIAILGLLYAVVCQRSKPWWILGSFVLLYYGVMGAGKAVFVRYMIPVLPVLALSAAGAIMQISTRLSQNHAAVRAALLVILTVGVGWQSLSSSLWVDSLLAQPDTRTRARNWLLKHNPPQVPVVTGMWPGAVVLPYRHTKFLINPATFQNQKLAASDRFYIKPLRWLNLNLIPNYQAAIALQSLGVRYVVAGAYPPLPLYSLSPASWQMLHQVAPVTVIFRVFRAKEKLVSCLYDTQDGFFLPFAPCANILRPGPHIEILALPEPEKKTSQK